MILLHNLLKYLNNNLLKNNGKQFRQNKVYNFKKFNHKEED